MAAARKRKGWRQKSEEATAKKQAKVL